MIDRRSFLGGLVAAPAVILTPGLLMPVKPWKAGKVYFEVMPPSGFPHYVAGWFLEPKTRTWKYYERMAVGELVEL